MGDVFTPLRRRGPVQSSAKALALAGLLVGCTTSKPVRLDAWGSAQNCHFAHVSKGNFETALHRVFDVSRPKVYGLRPEGGGALVEQHWTLDVVFASAAGLERWRLEYAPAGDGVDVHAEMNRALGPDPSGTGKEIPPLRDAASYQLLWSRIEYVLGSRADWPECKLPSKLPRSGLCSSRTSGAPPLRLAGAR